MQFKRQSKLVSREIADLLVPLSESSDLYDIVRESVDTTKYDPDSRRTSKKSWLLLPLIVCESIIGSYDHAVPAAAALHLMNTAAEVFDDTEDADSNQTLSSRYTTAIAINTGTTLLILAEKAITELKAKGIEHNVIIRVMEAINSYYTTACIGQHLDLTLTPEIANSEDTYFKIVGMKSASTMECACYIGALLASANQEMANLFSQFGNNLGIAAQIANDIDGITEGRDITAYKITLPVIYALAHTTGMAHDYLENVFIKQSDSGINIQQIKDILFSTGAIQYSIIQMELYKQKALDSLCLIEKEEVNVEQLKDFVK